MPLFFYRSVALTRLLYTVEVHDRTGETTMTDITEHNGVEFMRWGTITPALYFTALATSTSALLMFVSIAAYRPVVGCWRW